MAISPLHANRIDRKLMHIARSLSGELRSILLLAAALAALPALAASPAAASDAAPARPAPRPAVIQPPSLLRLDRLTGEQILRLEKIARDQGSSIAIPQPIAAALHLDAAQIAPVVRQVSFQQADGVKHGFARLNDGSGYFLFAREPDSAVTVYRVDKGFALLGAAHTFAGGRFISLDPAQARNRLQGEIAAWSGVLSPKGVVMPPPGKPAHAAAPPASAPMPDTPGSRPGAAPGQ